MKKSLHLVMAACAMLIAPSLYAQSESYQTPPEVIKQVLDAQPAPTVVLGSGSNPDFMAILQQDSQYMSLEDIALNEYRLGGIRANVNNFAATRINHPNSIYLKIKGEDKQIKGLPSKLHIANVKWSPANSNLVLANVTPREVELWMVDALTLEANKISKQGVNLTTLRDALFYVDEQSVIYPATIPGAVVPSMDNIAKGPAVQEVYGEKFGGRTIADVINNPSEEAMFEYLATSQLTIASPAKSTTIGEKAIISSIDISPNKEWAIVRTTHKPYSYITAFREFPHKLSIIELSSGKIIKTLEDKTVKEDKDDKTPKAKGYAWRNDLPATLYWSETLASADEDKKDEKKDEEKPEKSFQTSIYQVAAPFTAPKELILKSEYAFGGITWGNNNFAIYNDKSKKQKISRTLSFDPSNIDKAPEVLFTKSTLPDSLDGYTVIGRPYTAPNKYGKPVLYLDKKPSVIYFTNNNRPNQEGVMMSFIDSFDIKKKQFEQLWISSAPFKSSIIAISNPKKHEVLVSRESPTSPLNYAIVDTKSGKQRELTSFADPVPALRELGREFVSYTRKDGVEQRALLITPKGYDKEKDGTLPVFMWAYPAECKSRVEAEKRHVHKYGFIPSNSAAMLALDGYAVMLDMSMYIISENTKSEPNDLFISQLISNAEAAVDFVVEAGVGDREHIGVGGHSYGAFMTAHLLGQSDLFAAGVARSGAYNRSLTPFGFQYESRTFWDDPELYYKMSPFSFVKGLTEPILMIHGSLDENSGTFPVQSQRLYQALSYFGNEARYVVLPYESHGYRAIESNYQLWWETVEWLDKYLK